MAYEGEDSRHCARVEAAQRAVAKARDAYSKGGSVSAVNRANAELADANYRWNEWCAGRLPDER
jgi:hypothetical protein